MRVEMLAAVLSAAVAGTVFGGFSKERFRNPENIHSPAYFWMWNSKLDPEKLNAQLDDMRAHGMRSICICSIPAPRPWCHRKPSRYKFFHLPRQGSGSW